MRNLFFALVLGNLAFAAWSAWHAKTPRGGAPAAKGTPLRLVSEASEAASPSGYDARDAGGGARSAAERAFVTPAPGQGGAAVAVGSPGQEGARAAESLGQEAVLEDGVVTASPQQAEPSPRPSDASAARPGAAREEGAGPANDLTSAASRCVSIGPFAELADAAAASARLRDAGREPEQRAAEGDIWIGYWVHIDAIPSRDEANRTLSALRENGIAEAYLIPGEQDGDIISLGVFSDAARAGRLREQVRLIGFEPLVADRSRRGTVYWVDVTLPADAELDFESLQAPRRITRLEQRPCEPALS